MEPSSIVRMIHCVLKTGLGEMVEEASSCCTCMDMRMKKQMRRVSAVSQKNPGDERLKIRVAGERDWEWNL